MIEEEDEDWQEEEEHFVPEDLEDYHDPVLQFFVKVWK